MMGELSRREIELQQLRINGRRAKQQRLANKASTIEQLGKLVHELHTKKGKTRGKKSLRAARHAKAL